MRYKLMVSDPGQPEKELTGYRKNSKVKVEEWFKYNIDEYGLDWRAGYQIKFRKSRYIYTWRWIKNNELLKPS